MITGPHIEVIEDGNMDKIIVSSPVGVAGSIILYEFYPPDIAYVGINDGTIIKYDRKHKNKLSTIRTGYAYDCVVEKGKYYSDLIVFHEDEFEWAMVSDDYYYRPI